MNTPIADFVKNYNESGNIRFHMPGHKGVPYLGCESFDITEVAGADALYEADGIIAESERNASELFGFGHTFYSTEGSSQCIKAMLYLNMLSEAARENHSRKIIAARNVHKAFIHACALLDLIPEWIYPEDNNSSLCSCHISADTIKKILSDKNEKPLALYLTAPDYLGYNQDIKSIADVCKSFDIPLLVDNAHGAYLKFLPESKHPVDFGAFMSCDSAHKTFPVLTGGAYLQMSSGVPDTIIREAKGALALFGSTSPSYLTLQSLDLCNRYLSDGYGEKLSGFICYINEIKFRLRQYGWKIAETDPLKIVIETASSGYSGNEVADILRGNKIECEFADIQAVVLMVTPDNKKAELDLLYDILIKLPRLEKKIFTQIRIPRNKQAISIREAFFSRHELISIDKAKNRICAAPTVSCPPAVPVAVSGEVITEGTIELLEAYGITQIEVVVNN